jgi:Tfp pilus assembly protein PilX
MVKLNTALSGLRRRRNQRGMAVFLVVLVLTMVSAIGVFSMHSASLVDRATGFNRQNVQATAIVEFGVRGAATWLGPHKEEVVESKVRVPGCSPRLLAASEFAPCSTLKDTSLSDIFGETAPSPLSDGLAGQLNSPWDRAPIRAEVVTEMTEAFDAMAASRAGSAGAIKELTLTTEARVFPTDATSTTVCGTGSRGAMSQQRVRAHVIIQL